MATSAGRPSVPSERPHANGPTIARILVVDDDDSIRQLLNVILVTEGHDVLEAADGIEACELIEADPEIDLVVLDVMMPRLDGYGVLSRIREGDAHPDVAIVMLTAKGTRDDETKAQKAGSDGYVTKPFDPDMLVGLIDVTLMYSASDRAATRSERKKAFLPEIADTGRDGL